MAEEKLVDKMDGGTDKQIAGYVQELTYLNYVNPSPDSKERKNLPDDRNNKVNARISDLEAVIKKISGGADALIADKGGVDNIAEALVAEASKLPDANEKPKEREHQVQDFYAQAGVDYGQLIRSTVGLKGGVKISDLPENHPLRRLVDYVAAKKVSEEDRARFLQRQIISLGTAKPSSVAESLNKIAGTNLDPRYATPQESLTAYGAKLQAKQADYRANDPNAVYNKKAA